MPAVNLHRNKAGMLSSREQLGLETKFNVLVFVLVLIAVGLVLVLVLKQIVLVLTHLGLVFSKFGNAKSTKSVSYTHLTLPTILRV